MPIKVVTTNDGKEKNSSYQTYFDYFGSAFSEFGGNVAVDVYAWGPDEKKSIEGVKKQLEMMLTEIGEYLKNY